MWRHLDVSLEEEVFLFAKHSLCVSAYQPSALGIPAVMSVTLFFLLWALFILPAICTKIAKLYNTVLVLQLKEVPPFI